MIPVFEGKIYEPLTPEDKKTYKKLYRTIQKYVSENFPPPTFETIEDQHFTQFDEADFYGKVSEEIGYQITKQTYELVIRSTCRSSPEFFTAKTNWLSMYLNPSHPALLLNTFSSCDLQLLSGLMVVYYVSKYYSKHSGRDFQCNERLLVVF